MANQYNLSDEDYAEYMAEYDLYLDGKLTSTNTLIDSIREQNRIEQFKHDLRRSAAIETIRRLREAQRNE
jgi:predicted transposase YbfD/YdcC